MKMIKSFAFALACSLPLFLAQCGAVTDVATPDTETMELEKPAFTKAKVYYNTWLAGVEGGGSGIDMTFEWKALPENIIMKIAFFRGNTAKLNAGPENYTAKFQTKGNRGQDIIMHGDTQQEGVNTPPAEMLKFPFELTDKQVGIVYEVNGAIAYTIMSNLEEKETIAYPSAPPKEGGY